MKKVEVKLNVQTVVEIGPRELKIAISKMLQNEFEIPMDASDSFLLGEHEGHNAILIRVDGPETQVISTNSAAFDLFKAYIVLERY